MIGVIVVIVAGFILWRVDLSNINNRTLHEMKKRNREIIEDIFSDPEKHEESFFCFNNRVEVKKIARNYSPPPIDNFLIHFEHTPSNQELKNLEKEHMRKVEDIFRYPSKYEYIFFVYGNQINISHCNNPHFNEDEWCWTDYSLKPRYTTNPFTNRP